MIGGRDRFGRDANSLPLIEPHLAEDVVDVDRSIRKSGVVSRSQEIVDAVCVEIGADQVRESGGRLPIENRVDLVRLDARSLKDRQNLGVVLQDLLANFRMGIELG